MYTNDISSQYRIVNIGFVLDVGEFVRKIIRFNKAYGIRDSRRLKEDIFRNIYIERQRYLPLKDEIIKTANEAKQHNARKRDFQLKC